MDSSFPNPDSWRVGRSVGVDPPHEESPLPPITCWRCGKDVPADTQSCIYCAATLVKRALPISPIGTNESHTHARSIVRLMVIFTVMLGVSIVGGIISRVFDESITPRSWDALIVTMIMEGVDSILIIVAWVIAGAGFREERHSLNRRVLAWVFSMPTLAIMLSLNVMYHHLLNGWLRLDIVKPEIIQNSTLLMWWAIAICFQPAIMEELFFRYLMFGALRNVMGGHSVVWITAVMFAAAHIGVPLSLPVLFVLGVFLGYARLASGSIYLPIALHFLHNACVMVLNGNSPFGF